MNLNNKKVLLGLTGGIAIYKIASLIRHLINDHNCDVRVIMTKSAQEFMTPLIFETFTGNKVLTDMFEKDRIVSTRHIDLVSQSDIFLVAPATANIIGKVANGIADDLLSTMLMTSKPENTFFALAMNKNMYHNSFFTKNKESLINNGYNIIEPEKGKLATNIEGEGIGRLASESVIISNLLSMSDKPLKDKNILITGGPTREYLDSVRFISNPSTGKMGIALANSAKKHGGNVKLILGPTSILPPENIDTTSVISSENMRKAVLEKFDWADIVIMSAAVEDLKPTTKESIKIKKSNIPKTLNFTTTKDILLELGKIKKNQILVGFSVETENKIHNSIEKLKKKNLDYIIVNDPNEKGAAFGGDTNKTTIITKDEKILEKKLMTKNELADEIFKMLI